MVGLLYPSSAGRILPQLKEYLMPAWLKEYLMPAWLKEYLMIRMA
jgi:hypothetical protein